MGFCRSNNKEVWIEQEKGAIVEKVIQSYIQVIPPCFLYFIDWIWISFDNIQQPPANICPAPFCFYLDNTASFFFLCTFKKSLPLLHEHAFKQRYLIPQPFSARWLIFWACQSEIDCRSFIQFLYACLPA